MLIQLMRTMTPGKEHQIEQTHTLEITELSLDSLRGTIEISDVLQLQCVCDRGLVHGNGLCAHIIWAVEANAHAPAQATR